MHAVREGRVECVVKLLELGADRMVQNRDKQTVADMAHSMAAAAGGTGGDMLHYIQVIIRIFKVDTSQTTF